MGNKFLISEEDIAPISNTKWHDVDGSNLFQDYLVSDEDNNLETNLHNWKKKPNELEVIYETHFDYKKSVDNWGSFFADEIKDRFIYETRNKSLLIVPHNHYNKKSLRIAESGYYPSKIFNVQSLTGEVTEITDDLVVINLLIDSETYSYDKRGFPKEPLEKMGLIGLGKLIQVTTILSPGNITFSFEEGESSNYKRPEKEDIFKKIADSSLFKKLYSNPNDNESNF